MKKTKTKPGFTLLEIMLVLALIVIIFSITISFTQNYQVRADFNSQLPILISELRLAQKNAESGKNGSDYGIHLEETSYTVFQGSNYNPVAPENIKTDLSPTIQITNINLSGGGHDIIFQSSTGMTATSGYFNLSSSTINKSTIIHISPLGTINY